MAAPKPDPAIAAHLEWLGFVRPTGLVVSAPALVRAGAMLNRRDADPQRRLAECLGDGALDGAEGSELRLPDFRAFARSVLGWSFSPKAYAGTPESPIPSELEATLPEYGETLRPDVAVAELEPAPGTPPWQLLVQLVPSGEDFDRVARGSGQLEASAHGRLERLLRETRVHSGLLFNGQSIRLVSAPRGESSGWLDFRVADMMQTAGRPIAAALALLLSERRLLALPRHQRLAALLADSRKFQNEVSERLAEQVLHALYELLRGFQAAHDALGGELLRRPLTDDPDEVYRALITVILRLVFLLYAEERDMLPEDETFLRAYSLGGLYERLRADAALYPDTMDQRYGAWAQLLVLFRIIHGGADWPGTHLPKRHGVLFDPDRYAFLEGRRASGAEENQEPIRPPLVPDRTIWRVLDKLLVLDGERISYRALDVEQIGSVYETMMGFRLETATGRSVAVKPQKRQGAPTVVDLEALLAEPKTQWGKWLEARTERRLTDAAKKAVAEAQSVEDLHAALSAVIDSAATPDLVLAGAMVLQPSEERRRSGSHYTPRALTEPIVRTTLEPVLGRLRGLHGEPPRPEQILDLKACDPAMGSGAFLVEACRQLGEALVDAWHSHGETPAIPPHEDEAIFARRLVAQRCLYGVDRNPLAVDLAKVSLWLVTLAKEDALTFVDHALRHGDSLVGLSRRQIEAFHWDASVPTWNEGFEVVRVREHVVRAAELRGRIGVADESTPDRDLHDLWDRAQAELSTVRLMGDLVVAAFFEGATTKERQARRMEFATAVLNGEADRYRSWIEARRRAEPPMAPFHWEIEFPEVFERENPGFDAIVGNPPFMGGSRITTSLSTNYTAFLAEAFEGSRGKSDLVAYFFRRSFDLLRQGGALGLIATNTIRQGDTRVTGLRWIRAHGGQIYSATRRLRWPGRAAVVVSVVHIAKSDSGLPLALDGYDVSKITAYLLAFGPDENPAVLAGSTGLVYSGVNPNGKGFVLTPTERDLLTRADRRSADRIFPYLGSVEMNDSPDATATRYIIRFDNVDENVVRQHPALYRHLFDTVRVQRMASKERRLRDRWWLFSRPADELYEALKSIDRVLVSGRVATHHTFAFQPTDVVFSDAVTVFLLSDEASFAVLQSQMHELWAGFQGSSFKDDPRYIPEDCFETFPFPEGWMSDEALQEIGKAYYDFRGALMVKRNEGLTKTYNRFHDPDERAPDILRLRELHASMDQAVLNAYGWSNIPNANEFLLDYEVEEDDGGNRKKPWRYRWPDDVRDEVLARLLELNAKRDATDDIRSGAAAARPGRRPTAHGAHEATLF